MMECFIPGKKNFKEASFCPPPFTANWKIYKTTINKLKMIDYNKSPDRVK
jgi:hypothetical protein